MSLAGVRSETDKERIDSGFFSKEALTAEKLIRELPGGFVELGKTAAILRKGIFDIKAETYAESGVPFIRISNLKNGVISEFNIAFISNETHAGEKKTEVLLGDLAISKTAYPAASFVQLAKANVSQDVIAYRLDHAWSTRLRSAYISLFLNSKAGIALLARQFQGNVQLHLSLEDARTIPIPIFTIAFQKHVERLMLSCLDLQERASQSADEAILLLSNEVSSRDWIHPQEFTYQRTLQQVSSAERFDAEYFDAKYAHIEKQINAAGALRWYSMEEILEELTNGHTPLRHDLSVGEVPFLCAEHITDFQINFDSDKRITLLHHKTELARTALQDGDVLLTIKGKVGNVALVEGLSGYANLNQDVALLRLNKLLPLWWVLTFLNSSFGRAQVEQLSTGAINPFLGLANVRRIRIPVFSPEVMNAISEEVRFKVVAARHSRERAAALLERAKRAVDVAIEESEEAALTFLRSFGG